MKVGTRPTILIYDKKLGTTHGPIISFRVKIEFPKTPKEYIRVYLEKEKYLSELLES
jgi:hypothetical protein